MTSGLVFLSNGIKGGYPFIESISSFLPVIDEMIVVLDNRTSDGTRENLEVVFKRDQLRIVDCPFLIDEIGRGAYGIVRTFGYQACKGDIVVMFDADGVLHEKDVPAAKEFVRYMRSNRIQMGFWDKYRIYKPDLYYDQRKHKGVFNKDILGDHIDFYGKTGADSTEIRIKRTPTYKPGIFLFGYEHLWDTEDTVRTKVIRYGIMLDKQCNRERKSDEEYVRKYIDELKTSLKEKGQKMDIGRHPAIMKDKLESLTDEHFGYNFFEW